jgi:ER-bound oxygenase mpaB/B'/Rubber oxygenase, catalytic domain
MITAATSTLATSPFQFIADPLADDTIDAILDDWYLTEASSGAEQCVAANVANFDRLKQLSHFIAQWKTNGQLEDWQPKASEKYPADPTIIEPLQAYLKAAHTLPQWADTEKIKRAEKLFMEHGPLSCILLFCASLPECYVIPDLATVLHIAGQLEAHTEYRIRSTAAMIFPVMMKEGLTGANGGGIAQTLKVRLIHATIRHLILRGNPRLAVAALQNNDRESSDGVIAPIAEMKNSHNMFHALLAHGWNVKADGLPCDQEELAYTLLTFGYVFLRGMRKLGVGLSRADEEAYLHVWNIVGHTLGIDKALLCDTMPQARTHFLTMQASSRANPVHGDASARLGKALMGHMGKAVPWRALHSFPVLMTRYLCGAKTAQVIGVKDNASWLSHLSFAVVMTITRGIDAVLRLFSRRLSLSSLITRVVGYPAMSKVLMDQTRPLKLPEHLLDDATAMMRSWGKHATK